MEIVLALICLGIVAGMIFVALASNRKRAQSRKQHSGSRRRSSSADGKSRSEPLNYEETWPFYPAYAMSIAEQEVYWKLIQALPDYIVLAQVQASRILKVKHSRNPMYWINRVNRMSYDYVICHKNSYPLAVIELDDATHEEPDRAEADRRKNKALFDAGLKLIRWHKHEVPEQEDIRKLVAQLAEKHQEKRRLHKAA